MVKVKICGLTRKLDVDAAVAAGADALGFIVGFPDSPRNLTMERAAELVQRVPLFVDAVLVTTGELLAEKKEDVRRIRPDAIQLYDGRENPDRLRSLLGASLIRPYEIGGEKKSPRNAVRGFDALLTDTYRRGLRGGTGFVSDWNQCRRARREIAPKPMILSGGLDPKNVGEAIRAVRPYAVDVSSGVEVLSGVKSSAKMEAFVRKAKEVTIHVS